MNIRWRNLRSVAAVPDGFPLRAHASGWERTENRTWIRGSKHYGWYVPFGTYLDSSSPAGYSVAAELLGQVEVKGVQVVPAGPGGTGPAVVPEPGIVLLVSTGLAGMAGWRRRKRS